MLSVVQSKITVYETLFVELLAKRLSPFKRSDAMQLKYNEAFRGHA